MIFHEVETRHPYKIVGRHETYCKYNEAWGDACDACSQAVEPLVEALKTSTGLIEAVQKFRSEGGEMPFGIVDYYAIEDCLSANAEALAPFTEEDG